MRSETLRLKSVFALGFLAVSLVSQTAQAAEAKVITFAGGSMSDVMSPTLMTADPASLTTGYTNATWDASNGVKINVTPGTATVGFGSYVPEDFTGPGAFYLFRVKVVDQTFNTLFDEEFNGWTGSLSQSGGITTGTFTTTGGREWKVYHDASTTYLPPFTSEIDGVDEGISYPMDGAGPFSVLAATQFTIPGGVTSIYVNVTWRYQVMNGGAQDRTFAIGFQNSAVPPEQLFSFSAPPSSPPGAPTLTSLTPGNQQLLVAFTAGSAGSSAITDYEYTLDGSNYVSASTVSSPFTITGLTNGTSYTVQIRAVSSVGNGTSSNSVSATPRTVPDAPTNVVATPGNAQISLAYTAGSNGGSAITDYEVTFDNGLSHGALGSTSNPHVLSSLTNGTSYSIKLRAVNDAGFGAWSQATSATPRTVPGAPTLNSVTAGNSKLTVAFTAPVSNGGATLTDYEYSTNGGTDWTSASTTTSPFDITGLTNGTTYSVKVRAVNVAGSGAASNAISGKPHTTPNAPTALLATPGNGQVSLAFTAPSSNGGSAVTDYEYTTNGGVNWLSSGSSSSPVVITGLTNGTSYTFQLRAVNAAGEGAASTSVSSTPRTVPGAPSISSITAGDSKLTVAFTAPVSNGGAVISDYEFSTNGGGNWTSAGTTSPFEITGLSNGTTYSVTVRAVNVAGAGAASAPVGGTPQTVPQAPSISSLSPSNGAVSMVFVAPVSDGGSALTDYEYSTDGGVNWTPASSTSSPLVISGLTNGTSYTFILRAVNAVGAGPASASASVTPRTVPGAPAIVSVTPGNGKLTVVFTAPASDGGATITDYDYSLNGGGSWVSAGTTSPFEILGLANGTSYSVTVRAVNVAGAGAASAPVGGTPRTLPQAPTQLVATPSDGQVSISFTAPADGGDAITDYEYSINGGASWVSAGVASSPAVISGLANGTSYSFILRAVNGAGAGAASAAVSSTPRTVPGAPTLVSVAKGDTQLFVTFTAPASNGGATILDYEYSLDGGSTWVSAGLQSPYILKGLLNFTTYSVTMRAVNVAGPGASSATLQGTPLPPGASRVVESQEAPGANCTYGGVKLEFGIDEDHSGVLDASEVAATRYVCNGGNGKSSLVRFRTASITECQFGGTTVLAGMDDDNDGTLSDGEVDNMSPVCNGEDGFKDANGDGVDDRVKFSGGGCTSTQGDISLFGVLGLVGLATVRRRQTRISTSKN